MKYLLEKDKKKRISFSKNENKMSSIDFLSKSKNIATSKGSGYVMKKQGKIHGEQFGKCYPKNRCVFTNRSKSVYRMGKISRIKFRSYSSFGFLTGVQKSSW